MSEKNPTRREVESGLVAPGERKVRVFAIDEPGNGNASHEYLIELEGRAHTLISFQNGGIKQSGVNGVQNEVLLAIVRDRLEGFQSGDFACETNQKALDSINEALRQLQSRTKDRMKRGVEGKLEE